MRILVTGGTGFIGSHQVLSLLEAGHHVHVLDDLSNSTAGVLDQIRAMTGVEVGLTAGDIRDPAVVREALDAGQPEAVIHFAARKHVHESIREPLGYYSSNLIGLITLVDELDKAGVRRLIYSSSGSVYGPADQFPIPEDAPHRPTNPYSRTKSMGETILADVCAADPRWSVLALRYFNPAGAHSSGLIGEDPTGLRTNIVPVLMDVAVGALEALETHGDDYDTPDGTAVRDFIHVVDVADIHRQALDQQETGFRVYNIGRGEGVSVEQLRQAAQRATGRPIPTRVGPRRPGDVAVLYGDTQRAKADLGVTDYRDLDTICADAWRWRSKELVQDDQFHDDQDMGRDNIDASGI